MEMIDILRGQRNAAMDALADCNVQLHKAQTELAQAMVALAKAQEAQGAPEAPAAETAPAATSGERAFEIG